MRLSRYVCVVFLVFLSRAAFATNCQFKDPRQQQQCIQQEQAQQQAILLQQQRQQQLLQQQAQQRQQQLQQQQGAARQAELQRQQQLQQQQAQQRQQQEAQRQQQEAAHQAEVQRQQQEQARQAEVQRQQQLQTQQRAQGQQRQQEAARQAEAQRQQQQQQALQRQQDLQRSKPAATPAPQSVSTTSAPTATKPTATSTPVTSRTAGMTPVTLGNGQRAYVNSQGAFFDANGNPVSNQSVASATKGTPAAIATPVPQVVPPRPTPTIAPTVSVGSASSRVQGGDSGPNSASQQSTVQNETVKVPVVSSTSTPPQTTPQVVPGSTPRTGAAIGSTSQRGRSVTGIPAANTALTTPSKPTTTPALAVFPTAGVTPAIAFTPTPQAPSQAPVGPAGATGAVIGSAASRTQTLTTRASATSVGHQEQSENQAPAKPAATSTPAASSIAGMTQVTLGNGQHVFVNRQGAYFDTSGNPISSQSVAIATNGAPAIAPAPVPQGNSLQHPTAAPLAALSLGSTSSRVQGSNNGPNSAGQQTTTGTTIGSASQRVLLGLPSPAPPSVLNTFGQNQLQTANSTPPTITAGSMATNNSSAQNKPQVGTQPGSPNATRIATSQSNTPSPTPNILSAATPDLNRPKKTLFAGNANIQSIDKNGNLQQTSFSAIQQTKASEYSTSAQATAFGGQACLGAVYTSLVQTVGKVTNNSAAQNAKINQFLDTKSSDKTANPAAYGGAVWPPTDPQTGKPLYADVVSKINLGSTQPIGKNSNGVLDLSTIAKQMSPGNPVMIKGKVCESTAVNCTNPVDPKNKAGDITDHWMLATDTVRDKNGNVIGIKAMDPKTGNPVTIGQDGSAPGSFQSFRATEYKPVTISLP